MRADKTVNPVGFATFGYLGPLPKLERTPVEAAKFTGDNSSKLDGGGRKDPSKPWSQVQYLSCDIKPCARPLGDP